MLTGLILDGGPSRRMDGEWKALLPFGGETIIQRQVIEMRKACSEVIVVTSDPKPFLRLLDTDVRIITDYFPGKGPLGGMHAGLSLSKYPNVWVIGSHMPFPSAGAAQLLLARKKVGFDAAVPLVKGTVCALHGVYDKSCAEEVLALIKKGELRLSALLYELLTMEVPADEFLKTGIDSRFVSGIHTWEQYKQSLDRMTNEENGQLIPNFRHAVITEQHESR